MSKKLLLALLLSAWLPQAAMSASSDKLLEKLAPEFRAHQACIFRGLDTVKRDRLLRKTDRMKTSIFSQAVLTGTKLVAKGGAARANGHWYALNFSCDLTPDLMKATSFTYTMGAEIPEANWEDLGLWR